MISLTRSQVDCKVGCLTRFINSVSAFKATASN